MLNLFINIPFIGKWLSNRPVFLRVLENISWLSIDRILRMGVALFVGIWVTRYLGPKQYGLLNFAIAFPSLFGAFATLGIDEIVIREIVKTPEKTDVFLGTAFILRLAGAFFALLFSFIGAFFVSKGDVLTIVLIFLSASGFIFQAFLVIDYFYRAHIVSKYTIWAQNFSFLLISGLKIVFILLKAPLLFFSIAGLLEIFIGSFFLLFSYLFTFRKRSIPNQPPIRKWSFSYEVAKVFLKSSWPLILSSMAIVIYMRIDQVMIKQMLGVREVGIYSVAVGLSEAWYFIPISVAASVFPALIEAKKQSDKLYYKRLQNLYDLLAWISIAIGLIMTFFSDWLIYFLYGDQYIEAANVLKIYIWAGVFVSLGVVSGRWFLIENLQILHFWRTFSGMIFNVALNFILIKSYGVVGAAIATLLSQGIICYFFDFFWEKTRKMFYMKTKSLFIIKFIGRAK